jgi:hypothetical protein
VKSVIARSKPRIERAVVLALLGATLAWGGPLWLALLTACGDGAETTSGRRVTLRTQIAADNLTFTNAYGYEVTLERALISIGPLRFLEGAPVATTNDRFLDALGVRVARAHPGHYEEGGTIGEMLETTSVDLAAGPADLPLAAGITGTALSARFTFGVPPAGPVAGELGQHVVVVEGTAVKDGRTLPFVARAESGDVLDAAGYPEVAGCPFTNGTIEADGVVTLTVRLSVWLDQTDFALVTPSTNGKPVVLDPTQTPHKAFVRGLMKAEAYAFSYAPPAP